MATSETDAPDLLEHEALVDLPPSAKCVYVALRASGPLTRGEIVAHTALPTRTVRYALGRLDEETDLIEQRPYWADQRKNQYRSKESAHEETQDERRRQSEARSTRD